MTENLTAAHLRAYIERIERLEEEKAAIAGHVREVFAEAKGEGYDVKAMRAVLKKRKMDAQERAELESLEALYFEALGE